MVTPERPAWIADPDPDCRICDGTGWLDAVHEPATDTWDATECPCTWRD